MSISRYVLLGHNLNAYTAGRRKVVSQEEKTERGETNTFKTKLELFHTQPSVQHDFLPWGIVNMSPEVWV